MNSKNSLNHIGFIMDGNGRWATSRGLSRIKGHKQGLKSLESLIKILAEDEEVKQVSFYCFSTENWARPALEVKTIMSLLKNFLEKDIKKLWQKNISIKIKGDISEGSPFDDDLRILLNNVNKIKIENPVLIVNLCINYGGKNEIVTATKKLIENNIELTEENLDKEILQGELPLDLIVRTSGEHRLSNFLLWQSAYSEFIFTDYNWPDIDADKYKMLKNEFYNRDRRFGSV